MEYNWEDFKIRCSAINKVMSDSKDNPQLTEKQEKTLALYRKKLDSGLTLTPTQTEEYAKLFLKEQNKGNIILSTTCIEYLMIEYAWITEGMIPIGKESLDLMAIKKGNMSEWEAAQLLIRVDKLPYKQHKERIYNEYLSGEIDLYLGESVMQATRIADIKNAFDYPTFLKKINTGLENGQEQQVQGYEDITGATEGLIVNTLVDCPFEVIEEMKWKLARKLNCATTESPEFIEEWPKWERSMNFSHMPMHKRIFKIEIEPFSLFEQQRLYDRIKICREWLSNFHEQYQKINLS